MSSTVAFLFLSPEKISFPFISDIAFWLDKHWHYVVLYPDRTLILVVYNLGFMTWEVIKIVSEEAAVAVLRYGKSSFDLHAFTLCFLIRFKSVILKGNMNSIRNSSTTFLVK